MNLKKSVPRTGVESTGILHQVGVAFRVAGADGMAAVPATPGWVGQSLRPDVRRRADEHRVVDARDKLNSQLPGSSRVLAHHVHGRPSFRIGPVLKIDHGKDDHDGIHAP
jgi:hypothetical protein